MKKVDIIIPIYNALADVKQCVRSVLANRDNFAITLILVNDASDEATTQYLHEMTDAYSCIELIDSTINQGYSVSSNLGLKVSTAPYVVLMNSDVIVSQQWLDKLLRCANSAGNIGIVSPVTNAAIWQSVPYVPDSHTTSTINFPHSEEINEFADCVEKLSYSIYPELPYIHGYCQFIKREVLDTIGLIDAVHYPNGMGSELDFCFRAADAGFKSVVADDTFIYHGKAKSLNAEARSESNWYRFLTEKYTHERYNAAADKIKHCLPLDALRDATSFHIFREELRANTERFNTAIAVVVNTFEQHAMLDFFLAIALRWRQQGVNVHCIMSVEALDQAQQSRQDRITSEDELFLGYIHEEQLINHLQYYDVVIGNEEWSLAVLAQVQTCYPDTLTLYTDGAIDLNDSNREILLKSVLLVESEEEARFLSSHLGKHAYAISNLYRDRHQISTLQKITSLWRSQTHRQISHQSQSLLLLIKDALLYHRKDFPKATFSKGKPPLDQMITDLPLPRSEEASDQVINPLGSRFQSRRG